MCYNLPYKHVPEYKAKEINVKVKELIKRLSQFDENREALIRFNGELLDVLSIDDTMNDYVEIEITELELNEYNVGE